MLKYLVNNFTIKNQPCVFDYQIAAYLPESGSKALPWEHHSPAREFHPVFTAVCT